MKEWIFLIVFFFNIFLIKANEIVLNDTINTSISNKVLIENNGKFVLNTVKQEVDFGFKHTKGICKFILSNHGKSQNYIISIQQSRVDFVQLFVKRANGLWDTLPIINKAIGFFERPIKSIDFCYPIFLKEGETITCLLKSGREFGNHACVIKINSIYSFENYNTFLISYISFVSGICLVVSLAGFFLFLFLKSKMYLVYCVYCFLSFIVTTSDSGFFHSFFPSNSILYLNNNITSIAFYLIVGCHIFLTVVLLRLNSKESYTLFYIGKYMSIFFVLMGCLLTFPFIDGYLRFIIIKTSYYIVFAMDVYILTALIISLSKKQRFVYFYLAGFLFSLIGSTILILANLGAVDGINQDYNIAYIIPLIEIFCMLIGISFEFSDQNKKYINTQIQLLKAQKSVISIQDEEQKRIAQDLHDGIGQELTVLKRSLKKNNQETNSIDAIINDVRKVSRELFPVALKKMDLKDAIENLCEQLNEDQILFISYEIEYPNKLQKDRELQSYRIIQECINNAIKHAEAQAVKIEMNVIFETTLEINIKDNGKGFDVEKIFNSNSSFGLHTISNRVISLNGELKIDSVPNNGTTINIKIPIQNV